jgi:signal transduction histidine kinase
LKIPDQWRNTTFRMTIVFGAIFGGAVTALLGFIYWKTESYLTRQVDTVLNSMVATYSHMDRAELPNQVTESILYDARHINLIGIFSSDGKPVAGNLRYVPQILKSDGELHEFRYGPSLRDRAPVSGVAVAGATRLPSGEWLVLGRDVTQLAELRLVIERALIVGGGGILLVGLAGGLALSIRPLRRINDIREITQKIMLGDLQLRIPLSGRHDELDILARTVNSMLDEIARLLAEVKSVTDTIAHDLRTPLTRLRALLYRTLQESDSKTRQFANYEQAIGETDTLLRRFHALLRIAEIENRQRHAGFAQVDLCKVAEEIKNLFEPLAEEKGVHLRDTIEPVGTILADPDLLFEALSNLVDNAIKFTPAGGFVELVLMPTSLGPRMEIRDSGPGVSIQDRQAVLQRFYRSPNAAVASGFGLGLSIVSAILRLHHFKLEFQDAARGTYLRLDCWPHAPAGEQLS